ncbi:hypothetical protein JCM3766R1_006975 [Sporobolomyces carnicolor]
MDAKSDKDNESLSKVIAVDDEIAKLAENDEEVRLNRKLDARILPLLLFMYMFSSLDRSNLGNAKTDGFEHDLNFAPNDYSLVQTIFSVMFCTFTIPGNALTKKIGAHITLPIYMCIWGALCMINAACKDFAGVLVARILLGMAEAGFAPGVISYLCTFYRRENLGLRIAAFYAASPVAGAFGGLLAYGVFSIKSHLHGWQILFLLEGGLTVTTGLIALCVLPPSPDRCKWFTQREKEICNARILSDSSTAINESFDRTKFFAPLKDWMLYVYALIALCYGTPASAATSWLPQVIGRLDYGRLQTNALTVPPNALGAMSVFLLSWISDRTRCRSTYLLVALTLTFVGFVILAALDPAKSSNNAPSLFAVFLLCSGAFGPSVLFHTWHNNNEPDGNGRAFRTAFLTFCANAGGIIASQVFRAKDAPKYSLALYVNFSCLAVAIVTVIALRCYMSYQITVRNRIQGVNWTFKDVPTEMLTKGHSDVNFRFFL